MDALLLLVPNIDWGFWMMALAATVAIFRIGRQPLPGHCDCGYNLTSNTSGICPECGTPVKKAEK